MNIILLEKIDRMGELGDQVSAKAGYARNYLIPSGKALPLTPQNLEKFEQHRAELEREQADTLTKAEARAEALNATTVRIERMASDEGKLFGSVTAADIAKAVSETGLELAKSELRLSHGPLRSLGEFEVHVHLHPQVDATVTVNIAAQEESSA